MRKQIRIRKRGLAVVGATVVLSLAPLSAAGAHLPKEITHSHGGCDAINPQQDWAVAKICRDLTDGSQTGVSGVTDTQTGLQRSSSDSMIEDPFFWVVAIATAGVAGTGVAVIRRHRPAALS